MLSPATSKTHSRPTETSSDRNKENILCEFREQRTRARKNTTGSDPKCLREKFWTAGAVVNSTIDKLFPDSSIHRSILKGALHQGVLDLRALPPSIREELPRELHAAWKEQHAIWKQLHAGSRVASSDQIQNEIEYLPNNEWVFINLEDHSDESIIGNLYTVMDCVDKSAGSISQPYRYLHKISHMFLDLKQGGKSVHDLPESERSRIRDVTRKFFEGISPVCSKARLRKACRNFYSEIYSGSEANTLKSVGMISRYRTAPDPDIKIRINAKIQALHGSMPGIPKFEKKKRSEVGKYNPEYLNQIASMEVTGTNNIEKLEEIIKLASKLPAAKQKIFWSHQHFSEPSILTRAFRLSNEGSSDFMLSYFVHSDLKPLEKAEIFRSSTGFGSIDTEWTRGVKKELFNQFKELESKGSNRVDNNVFNILDQASNFDVEEQVLEAEDRVLVEALRNSVKAQDCEAFERAFNALQTLSPPISDEIDMFCNAMRDDTGSLRVITSVEFYSTCMVMFERMANRVTPAACEGNLNLQRMLWEKMGENTPRMDPTAVRQSSATPEASGTVRAPISSNNESASEALKVLGLHDDAFFSMTLDKQIREIHSARNGLALALHPDKNLDVGNFDFRDEGSMGRFHGKTADEATKEVNTAFGILKAFF